ncbi:MAG: DUF1385 domain-containing protein [Oscillospiraceae bacterium]|nr:DUF1385 domain-containing protein [Oscillospiraceae bacterium]
MKKNKTTCVSVGGQALMEGILMNGPKGSAMALRLPDGSIEVSEKKFTSIKKKYKFFGMPIIRGVVNFIETMLFGYRCLMESAEKTSLDMGEDNDEEMSKIDKWITDHFGEKFMSVIGAISMVLGLALAFGLFIWLPTFLFDMFNKLADGSIAFLRTVFEGVLRIIIFVVYMIVVSKNKDIKRVYMYHGAEHKSIFCLESGEALTVENVRKQKRFHPRCGTSFIFVMIILSILISSIIAVSFPVITTIRPLWIAVKVLMMPFIMGLGYEFIKYAGKHDNVLVKVLSAPGLWMQRITTIEPTDDMIEVGIAALNAVIEHPEVQLDVTSFSEDDNQLQTEADTEPREAE